MMTFDFKVLTRKLRVIFNFFERSSLSTWKLATFALSRVVNHRQLAQRTDFQRRFRSSKIITGDSQWIILRSDCSDNWTGNSSNAVRFTNDNRQSVLPTQPPRNPHLSIRSYPLDILLTFQKSSFVFKLFAVWQFRLGNTESVLALLVVNHTAYCPRY